jgi:signal transduction histidine kinase
MTTVQGHILVVDDYPMNRMKLSRVLEQQGHTVELAEDGNQALALLRKRAFDVVLLDIIMPEMDGHQVLEEMKRDSQLRDIPVIVISALDEIDSVVRCIEMGAEDYLQKPFNPVLLKARVTASLGKKKLRDLERAYLRQEMTLRQSEKLATLGKLSAGMAHELNNPAAAAQRGADQLHTVFGDQQTHLKLGCLNLTEAQLSRLQELDRLAREKARDPSNLDSLARSDREYELETWLADQGVTDSWEYAPALVSLGYSSEDLASLVADFTPGQLPDIVAWLGGTVTIYSLLEEIGQGSGRITEIVRALKAYTYLDQASFQAVDVHEGLDNTLVMLGSKLKQGIIVRREYDHKLPRIQAFGSELNQVWTNIIDNAVDAMEGQGAITIRTCAKDRWIEVEIEDNGPGIPEDIQPKVFDPFFTTKPPGKGAGLGLNISHNIIVQKQRGEISVTSHPGKTCFRVKLPLDADIAHISGVDQ